MAAKLKCRSCGFSIVISEKEAKFGMTCPECYSGNMKRVDKRKPGRHQNRAVDIRASTIRALIGGGMLLFLGIALLAYGRSQWNVGMLGARLVGGGIVMIIAGVISLLVGFIGIIRDVMMDSD